MRAGRVRRVAAFAALWQAVQQHGRGDGPDLRELLLAVPRLAAATARGTYPGLDARRLLMMAGALTYVASPVDLVPEALFLIVGLTDDAVVLSWLAGAVLTEARAFLEWEAGTGSRGGGAPGRVVPGDVVG